MKESFAAVKPQTEPQNSQEAIVPRAPRTIATTAPSVGGLVGEFSSRDFKTPSLKLVGKQSELVNEGKAPGSFVFNKDQTVSDGKTPLRVIVATMAKEYWQKLPQGSQAKPMVFKTIAEVHEAGGSNEYGDDESIPFQDCGRCHVLIESDTEQPGFIVENDGKYYAPAMWFLSGTAYNSAGRQLATDGAYTLAKQGGLRSRYYEVTSKIESNSKGSWFLPVLRLTQDKVSPELSEKINQIFP